MPVLTDLVLEHFTDQPMEFDRRIYEQGKPLGYMKPNGFWVSVAGPDDWPAWCRREEFRVDTLEHRSVVVLADDANILHISTPEQLDEFHLKFCVDDVDFPRSRPWMFEAGLDERKYWSLDWAAVAQQYQGVIIAPYQWPRRLDVMWYYGWDCASGCIWDLDAIVSVTPVVDQ